MCCDSDPSVVILLRKIIEKFGDSILSLPPPYHDINHSIIAKAKQTEIDRKVSIGNLRPRIYNNIIVNPPEHKLSDWDFYLSVNHNVLDDLLSLLNSIHSDIWVLLTNHSALRYNDHFHKDRCHSIKIGIFLRTSYAPFVELNFINVSSAVIKSFYKSSHDDQLFEWLAVIMYRKYKINNRLPHNTRLITDHLDQPDQRRFISKPVHFLRSVFINSNNPVMPHILKYCDSA